jgi:hypothetical protein
MQEGTLKLRNNRWVVQKANKEGWLINHEVYNSDNNLFKEDMNVKFIIIDEFLNPEIFEHVGWGDGANMAFILE